MRFLSLTAVTYGNNEADDTKEELYSVYRGATFPDKILIVSYVIGQYRQSDSIQRLAFKSGRSMLSRSSVNNPNHAATLNRIPRFDDMKLKLYGDY